MLLILLLGHLLACFLLLLLLLPARLQVIKNKIRGVNMKGFGYGGEDAYFYATGQ
jgi:hypothetical protein